MRLLTASEMKELDPTGSVGARVRHLLSITDQVYERYPTFFTVTSDEVWASFLERHATFGFRLSDEPYMSYWREMLAKCGRQGGHFPGSKLIEILNQYYDIPQVSCDSYLIRARDYLIKEIRALTSVYGHASYSESFVCGTFAALPSGSLKGSFDAETLGMKPWRHAYPATPGTRFMRGKPRAIFQSANPNVRALEGFLGGIRKWLRKYLPKYFNSWLNPALHVRPLATRMLAEHRWIFEGDYQGMDTNFSLRLVQELIFPVLEAVWGELPYSYQSMLEEMFYTSLYLGDRVMEGEHTLFSGEIPTNDFETIFTVILVIATALAMQVSPTAILLMAIGDDSAVGLPKSFTAKEAEEYAATYVSLSATAGEVVHTIETGKSRLVRDELRYCRQVYTLAGKKDLEGNILGAYPTCLTINNIVRPEHLHKDETQFWGAVFQRLDGAMGARDWTLAVQHIISVMPKQLRRSRAFLNALQAPTDWWERLYGEVWDPQRSCSLNLAQKLNCFQS